VDFPGFGRHGQHAIYAKVRNKDGKTLDSYPLYLTT